jgi:hypothetical protein
VCVLSVTACNLCHDADVQSYECCVYLFYGFTQI